MKPKHRDNLLKLAAYLDALPADYEEFCMSDYNRDNHSNAPHYRSLNPRERQYGCGTVACAVGHGPAAGIRVHGDYGWDDYCFRVFGVSDELGMYQDDDSFDYMFGTNWTRYDNTPHGAAERIRTYVSLGGQTPDGWND
jgi:hypothetical protein